MELLKPTKTRLINMLNVRFSYFFNFALWAKKFIFTYAKTKANTEAFIRHIFWEFYLLNFTNIVFVMEFLQLYELLV